MASDIYWSSVVALLHMDGADGSTTFTDAKGHTFTPSGAAAIETDQSKFGGASGIFPSGTSQVTTPDHADFEFAGGDFTIEFWYRPTTVAGLSHIMLKGEKDAFIAPWIVKRSGTSVLFSATADGVTYGLGQDKLVGTVAVDTWYFITISRVGDDWYTFIDGVQTTTWNQAGSIFNNADLMRIGGSTVETTLGYLDDVRLTKGVGRYSAGFSVPTGPFPTETDSTATGALSFSGSLGKGTGKVAAGTLSFAGSMVKSLVKAFTAGLTSSGSIAKQTSKTFTAGVSFSGDFGISYPMSAALIAPAPTLSITAISGVAISAALIAPAPTLIVVNNNPALIVFSGTAGSPLLVCTAVTGNTLTAALTAASPTLSVSVALNGTITVALVAPAPRLVSVLSFATLSAYRTWVLNTRKLALSEYGSEFAFNSFAEFQGQVLACGASGIVVLGLQDDDAGTDITARVRTGKESFSSSLHKRVPRIYTSGEFAGDMKFRTILTESGTRTYSLPFNGITGLQQRRVPVGKGPKSRFFQFELENVDGADFDLNDVLVLAQVLRRRVQ